MLLKCHIICQIRYSTPGGYSSKAVHPIALAKVMSIAKMMKTEFGDKDHSLSAIGGVETGGDAAEFLLLGANTVQVGHQYNYFSLIIILEYYTKTRFMELKRFFALIFTG